MKSRFTLAFAAVVGICVFALPFARDSLMRFDRSMQQAFESLPMGISIEDATKRLGSAPIREADECCLPQLQGFESEFDRARNSDAVRFYLFRNGINWYYSLGFDADGRLVVTGEGQS